MRSHIDLSACTIAIVQRKYVSDMSNCLNRQLSFHTHEYIAYINTHTHLDYVCVCVCIDYVCDISV